MKALITEAQLKKRVKELGAKISRDYKGKSLDLVAILKGAVIFMSDLARHIEAPLTLDFMRLSSYHGTRSTGKVRVDFDVTQPIEGKHVLIVEDIVDTGLTMDYLVTSLKLRKPASLKICALLSKPSRRQAKVEPDYVGFEIEDHFVVGYGLDYNGLYRNLPYIGIYEEEKTP